MITCVTHKKCYTTKEIAEDALIDAHINFSYPHGNGPVAVYVCDDCGYYHLTSKGPMNERLLKATNDGLIKRQKEASQWANKLKKRGK